MKRTARDELRRINEWKELSMTEKATALIGSATAGIVLGHLLLAPLSAYAASLPYVDDANERVDGKYNVTVIAAGMEPKLQLRIADKCTGKKVKPVKLKRAKNVWIATLKKRHTYKLSVRGVKKSGKKTAWKSIEYRIL